MFWNPDFLLNLAAAAGDMIKSFECEINKKWENVNIVSGGTESGVYKYFLLEIPSETAGTVTGFRAVGASGNVLGSKKENIVKSAGTAMIYKFKMRIYEEVK